MLLSAISCFPEIIGNQLVNPKLKLHGGHFDWCAVLHQ